MVKHKDITCILMVGGSTKIPFVKEVIENYCVTNNLKEVSSFDVDLAVSAGAGFIANSYGFEIEDEVNNILVKMNAPYIIDGQIYISGNVVEGKVEKILLKGKKAEHVIEVLEDGTFLTFFDAKDYTEKCTYTFVNGDKEISEIESTIIQQLILLLQLQFKMRLLL